MVQGPVQNCILSRIDGKENSRRLVKNKDCTILKRDMAKKQERGEALCAPNSRIKNAQITTEGLLQAGGNVTSQNLSP